MTGQSKEWGPGEWISIHVTAAWVDSSEKFKFFCTWIRNIIEHLPCGECTKHAKSYLDANPPEKAEDAFIWAWQFHNAVNRRLGKPEMEYDTAKQIYIDGGINVCNNTCGKENVPTKPIIEDTFNFRPSRF